VYTEKYTENNRATEARTK